MFKMVKLLPAEISCSSNLHCGDDDFYYNGDAFENDGDIDIDVDDIDTRQCETKSLRLILLTRDLQHFYKVKSSSKV